MTASHKSPDSDLFAELMEDVTPLKQNDKVSYFEPHTTPTLAQQHKRLAAQLDAELDDNILSTEYIDLIDPLDFIAYKKDGVQDGVYKNLRLGKYGVDATLDLHGQSLLQARQALYETVSDCHQRNIRVLLVRHGTGERNQSPKRAAQKLRQSLAQTIVLRTCLPQCVEAPWRPRRNLRAIKEKCR